MTEPTRDAQPISDNGQCLAQYGRVAVLALVLVLAAFLRFSHLEERGLLAIDEGYYADGVKSYVALGSYALGRIQGNLDGGLASYFEGHGGHTTLSERPTFLLLGYLASLVLGFHDYTLLYLSAFFGTLTVGLTYLVGGAVFDRWNTALLPAFLLAISPLHIAFSRSAYPHVAAAALVWLATLVYLKALNTSTRSSTRWRLASGSLVGLAFTVHTGVFWLPIMLFCSEAVRLATRARREGFVRAASTMGALAVVMALPLLLWEVVFRVGRWLLLSNPAWAAALRRPTAEVFETYFEGLFWPFVSDAEFVTNAFLEPLFYVKFLYTHEGGIVFILAAAGLVLLVRNAQRTVTAGWVWVAALFVVPTTIFSLMAVGSVMGFQTVNGGGGARHVVLVVPAMCLLASRGAVWIVDILVGDEARARVLRVGVGAAIVALVVSLEAGCIREILAIRSNYRAAIDYMSRNAGVRHLSDRMYVARVYVGRSNAIDHFYSLRASEVDRGRHRISLGKLKQVYEEGYRYFVRHSRQPAVVPPYDNELVAATENGQVQPEFTVSQPVGCYWPAVICRSERDVSVPQELQVFAVEAVIRHIEQNSSG